MGSSNGGGSAAGKCSWPTYMERLHWNMLIGSYGTGDDEGIDLFRGLWSTRVDDYSNETSYFSLLRDIVEAHEDSPFATAEAYDPESRLDIIQTQYGLLNTMVNAMSHDDDWGADWDTAQAQIDEVISSSELTALTTQFEADLAQPHANAMARAAAAASDVGANNDAAYIMMKGVMEQRLLEKSATFNAQASMQQYELKLKMYGEAVRELQDRMFRIVDANRVASTVTADLERISIVALKEENDRNIELDIQDHTWEVELWGSGANVLGAIGGSRGAPGYQKSVGNSALGGALSGGLSGAGSGALIGTSVAPGIGTGIGAGVGGILGALGGGFGGLGGGIGF